MTLLSRLASALKLPSSADVEEVLRSDAHRARDTVRLTRRGLFAGLVAMAAVPFDTKLISIPPSQPYHYIRGDVDPFRHVVIYNDTPNSPADPLICWFDYGEQLTRDIQADAEPAILDCLAHHGQAFVAGPFKLKSE